MKYVIDMATGVIWRRSLGNDLSSMLRPRGLSWLCRISFAVFLLTGSLAIGTPRIVTSPGQLELASGAVLPYEKLRIEEEQVILGSAHGNMTIPKSMLSGRTLQQLYGLTEPVAAEPAPAAPAAEPETSPPDEPSEPASPEPVAVTVDRPPALPVDEVLSLEDALRRAGENRSELKDALNGASSEERPWVEFLLTRAPQLDLVNATADHFLETVRAALAAREELVYVRDLDPDMWAEFVLSPRVAEEDADHWRPEFYETLLPMVAEARHTAEAVEIVHNWYREGNGGEPWIDFLVSESRDQSPRQLFEIAVGRCYEMNLTFTALLRSIGVPARVAGTAWWLTGDFYHYWVEYWDSERRTWRYHESTRNNPEALSANNRPYPAIYAMPGYLAGRDPIGTERWEAMINTTSEYGNSAQLDLAARLPGQTGQAEFALYSWNMGVWRLAARGEADEFGRATFHVRANDSHYPYLATAVVDGNLFWQTVFANSGATRQVNFEPSSKADELVVRMRPDR